MDWEQWLFSNLIWVGPKEGLEDQTIMKIGSVCELQMWHNFAFQALPWNILAKNHPEIIVNLSAMVRLWEGSREVLWSFQHCHSVLSCPMSHNRAPCLSFSKAPQSWMECQKGLASPLESFEGQQWALPSLAWTQTETCENKLIG